MALQLAELRATHAVSAWCDPRTGVLMSLTGVRSRIGFPAHSANFYGLLMYSVWRSTEFDILLANDAGVAHLADALGLPVITIFLSREPGHFAPFANRDHVISFEGACDVRPCFGRCTKSELLCFAPASYVVVVAARVTATLARLFD